LALAILAILGGAAAGAVGALFRLWLVHADRLRGDPVAWVASGWRAF